MKYRMPALIFALAVMSWAQTATPAAPSDPQSGTPAAKCACCEKMVSSDAKGAPSCSARHGDHKADGKAMASCCTGKHGAPCCGGKDAKSSMKAGKDKCCSDNGRTAKACSSSNCEKECKDGKCCGARKVEKAESGCCDRNLRSQIDPSHNFAAGRQGRSDTAPASAGAFPFV